MEEAIGAASFLIGKVLNKLSDDLVAAYVASSELGLSSEQIIRDLLHLHGLLHEAQGRAAGASSNHGLQALLVNLSNKADKADDALDELHYFMIQDQIHGTQRDAPGLGRVLRSDALPLHGRRAIRHTTGNCFPCFCCPRTQDDGCPATDVATNPHNATKFDTADDGGYVDNLPFDRVAMSNKIKLVMVGIHSLCDPVSDLLRLLHNSSVATCTTVPLKRPFTVQTILQDALYGQRDIFEKTVDYITSHCENLSVLPIVGPGGIGKTTFTQLLYSDERIVANFAVRVWICVSFDFNVYKLTQEILVRIPETEQEGSNISHVTMNLGQLQNAAARRLRFKRFLIVLDDIWKCDSLEWGTLLAPFTEGEAKGNMVLITTRFPRIAELVRTGHSVQLQALQYNGFLNFFEACIFGAEKPEHFEDDLSDIAREIAKKLKGAPLAAQTVAHVLRRNLSREYWMRVLENSNWVNQQDDADIMPSLKLCYDYLPFHLKRCFQYFSLFEDYRFDSLEMNRLWTALGIIDSGHPGDNNFMEELVDLGFLIKDSDISGQYYLMHDLMHELSHSVSAQECVRISDLYFRAVNVPRSVRHISITIENIYDEQFAEEMGKLKKRIDIVNLWTLMIFRGYEERISEILKDTFKEIKGLRILFIEVNYLESFPHGLSELIHLQYLKITSPDGIKMILPSILSRFYHLKFLDLKDWHGSINLPKDISRLVNLRDFLAEEELHSNISEVGKMKYLQELKEFHVKKKSMGFELRELGALSELGGALSIYNLENVATKEEAVGAELMSKRNLKRLKLVWGRVQPTIDADVLDALKPHSNLRALCIINHCGTTGPSWLCLDMSVKSLETLQLEGVSWGTLPPFEQLPYLKELRLERISRAQIIKPFPACLRELHISHVSSMQSMALLSNLMSLTHLTLVDCNNLTMDGFNPLITVNLKELVVYSGNCPESLAADVLSEMARTKLMPPGSFQLERLVVDRISGVLVSPVCKQLSATLHELSFCKDEWAASFTEEEEQALQLLTSLQKLEFSDCKVLQSLPQGLHHLSSLEELVVSCCYKLRWLPKEGFPTSLENLSIIPCSTELTKQIAKLKGRHPDLRVHC